MVFGNNLYIDNVRIIGTILPVELSSFSGLSTGDGNLLRWATATEQNNQGFEIERSLNSEDWEIIDFVEGSGTTNEEQYYEYLDGNIISTENYYRLKQIDFDRSFEYSNTIVIANEQVLTKSLSIFPNPVSDNLNIVNGQGLARVTNMLGQLVLEKNIVNENASLNVSSLSSGQYILVIQKDDGNVISQQFSK